MRIIRTHSGKEVKIFAETFENEAYDQIKRLANYPAYENSDRKSTRLNSSHRCTSRMPSSA